MRSEGRYDDSTSATIDAKAFNRGTDPILQFLTVDQARAIVEYRGDATLQGRIEELAELSNNRELSDAERAEYEGYARSHKFVAILQARAGRLLSAQQ